MWHSKWLCYQWMVSIRSLRPQQPGKDKNRAGSMAMWVAPISVYNHLSSEIPIYYFNLYSMLSLYGRRLLIPTVDDIHSIHSSEMSGRSCVAELQDVLVELQYIVPRVHWSEGGSIPCHSWKSIIQYVLAILIVYYICRTWDESVSARWLYILWLIDIIIISKGFWYKDILDSHKGKTHSVLRRGLMRYRLLVQTVLNCFTHTSPMTDPKFTLLFSLNSWVPKFVRAVK